MNNLTNKSYHVLVGGDQLERLEEKVERMEDIMKHVKKTLCEFNKFSSYPKWLTKDQALEILPFDTYHLLKKYVNLGIITSMEASESGRRKVYLKADCINFPELLEEYKLKKIIQPSGRSDID